MLYTISADGNLTDTNSIKPSKAEGIRKISNGNFLDFQEEDLRLIDAGGYTL